MVEAKKGLEIANLRAARESAEERYKEITKLKNDQIEFLQKQAIQIAKKEKNINFYLIGGIAGGVILGIGLTIGTAFIVKELR